jgi:adenine phosphoribosyltransferase
MPDRLHRAVRTVPDFPSEGIQFKDLTPILGDSDLYRDALQRLVAPFQDAGITHVVGIESRGFWFGPAMAQQLAAGFVPARKPGKLPAETIRESYDLEYGTDSLELHADAFGADVRNARVLIHDDVIATGGTAAAACALVKRAGGTVVGCSFVMEIAFLNGRSLLPAGMWVETAISAG